MGLEIFGGYLGLRLVFFFFQADCLVQNILVTLTLKWLVRCPKLVSPSVHVS